MRTQPIRLQIQTTHTGLKILDDTGKALTKIDIASKSTQKAVRGLSLSFSSLAKAATATLGVFAGYKVLRSLTESFWHTNKQLQVLEVRLAGFIGSSEKASAAMRQLFSFSVKTGYSVDSLTKAFMQLQVAGLDPIHGSMQSIIEANAALGGSAQDLIAITTALMQMSGKGVISMEEIRQQMGERLPTAMGFFAKAYGKTMTEFIRDVSRGKVTTEIMGKAIKMMGEAYAGATERIFNTAFGQWGRLRAQWQIMMREIGKAGAWNSVTAVLKLIGDYIQRMMDTGKIKEFARAISEIIAKSIETMVIAVDKALGAIKWAANAWEEVRARFTNQEDTKGKYNQIKTLEERISMLRDAASRAFLAGRIGPGTIKIYQEVVRLLTERNRLQREGSKTAADYLSDLSDAFDSQTILKDFDAIKKKIEEAVSVNAPYKKMDLEKYTAKQLRTMGEFEARMAQMEREAADTRVAISRRSIKEIEESMNENLQKEKDRIKEIIKVLDTPETQEALKRFKERIPEYEALMERWKKAQLTKTYSREYLQAQEDARKKIIELEQGTYALREQMMREYYEKEIEIAEKIGKSSKDLHKAMRLDLAHLRRENNEFLKWWSKAWPKAINNASQSFSMAMQSMVFDGGSFKEAMARMGESVLKMLADIIAQLITMFLIKQMITGVTKLAGMVFPGGGAAPEAIHAPMAGQLVAHEGGRITATGLEKFHSGGVVGLRPDERMIIAQVGETIIPKGTDGTPGVIVNIHNEGEPLQASETTTRREKGKMVLDLFLERVNSNPSERQRINRSLGR